VPQALNDADVRICVNAYAQRVHMGGNVSMEPSCFHSMVSFQPVQSISADEKAKLLSILFVARMHQAQCIDWPVNFDVNLHPCGSENEFARLHMFSMYRDDSGGYVIGLP
jgi:hypothetical protein